MVDRADLDKASRLSTEEQSIERALEAFTRGGSITAMTVSQPESEVPGMPQGMPGPWVVVSTVGIAYPPTMVDVIREAFAKRQGEIKAELAAMGVTGG